MVAEASARRLLRVRLALAAALILALLVMLGLFVGLQPTALSLAQSRARVLATDALNDAIAAIMDQNISYDDLMQVTYDSYGRVAMLQANTMRMNELGSRIVLEAQRNLEQAGRGLAHSDIRGHGPAHIGAHAAGGLGHHRVQDRV